jgi:hypothetical protein
MRADGLPEFWLGGWSQCDSGWLPGDLDRDKRWRRIVKPAEPAKAELQSCAGQPPGSANVPHSGIGADPAHPACITEGDRAGILPTVDLSYFAGCEVEPPKRRGDGLLVVWRDRKHLA